MFLPKDFIQTAQGLLFAVVAAGREDNKIRCFLRYVRGDDGQWRKVPTEHANALLSAHYPFYCFHSPALDAFLHGVPFEAITAHFHPSARLAQLLNQPVRDTVEADCVALCHLFKEQGVDISKMGVTGSLLISQQTIASDIDLVCYDLAVFEQCRMALRALLSQGDVTALRESDWRETYARRDCDMDFEAYVWHEQRKWNKALINGRKCDLSVVEITPPPAAVVYQKVGRVVFSAQVLDDARAFCYPAEWGLNHLRIQRVVCFTATYTGQAIAGEWVEIAGQIEEDAQGNQRVVVGSNREARGEYIKVIQT